MVVAARNATFVTCMDFRCSAQLPKASSCIRFASGNDCGRSFGYIHVNIHRSLITAYNKSDIPRNRRGDQPRAGQFDTPIPDPPRRNQHLIDLDGPSIA